jgi:hypothetical protein
VLFFQAISYCEIAERSSEMNCRFIVKIRYCCDDGMHNTERVVDAQNARAAISQAISLDPDLFEEVKPAIDEAEENETEFDEHQFWAAEERRARQENNICGISCELTQHDFEL